jgi:ankyrin repeat protein
LRNTPLHIAAKHGHLLIVKFLMENGALVNYANANGFSPYELAHQSIDIVSSQAFSGGRSQAKGQISQLEASQIIASL